MKSKVYCRIYQQIYRILSYFVKWRVPEIFQGESAYTELIAKLSIDEKIFIVTDKALLELGLLNSLLVSLESNNISYVMHANILPNPTVLNVEEALQVFNNNKCSLIIGFGGGSPIDCAKVVAARAVCPKKSVAKMKGVQKIRRKTIPLVAIPTTAGAGTETTIAAVITDDTTREKYAISDMNLIPRYAVFDYKLAYNLPPFMTAITGMDALTHAIEAFVGRSNTKQTKLDALMAVKLIYENLYTAYSDGKNAEARKSMQFASFYAGKAFTRAYVGNVHAIAHTLGGVYNVAHGYANAVTLPVVLRAYGDKVEKKLSIIADHIGVSDQQDSISTKSMKLICWIEGMNKSMDIPSRILEIQQKDIHLMAKRAYKEANPLYPVPEIWSVSQFESIFVQLRGEM